MTDEYDVVVIGGGLAGRMAALAAADQGASVRLLSTSESTLRSGTGLIDVLGYPPGEESPIPDPFDRLEDLSSEHPYSIVGAQAIRDGLDLFDSVVGETYGGSHTDRNALLPTLLGTAKPAARYPASMEPGLLSRDEDVLFVGLDGLAGIDGEFIATGLAPRVPYAVRGVNIDFGIEHALDQPRLRLATALDGDESWPHDDPIRTALVDQIEPLHDGEPRIGLPAILGRNEPAAVRRSLEADLDAQVFEIPTDPPSLPGVRLSDQLDEAIRSRGIESSTGIEITGFTSRDGTVIEIETDQETRRFGADQFVLATGGLIGGGLVESGGEIVESTFGLETVDPNPAAEWRTANPLESQPVARVGVEVEESLRAHPADEHTFNTVRACGSVLAGYDPTAEHSGAGVAIATGTLAGNAAAREALER